MAFLLNKQVIRAQHFMHQQQYMLYRDMLRQQQSLVQIQSSQFSGQTKTQEIIKPKQIKSATKKFTQDVMDLTKFKLSGLNSIAAFTMFYYHAPLATVGLLPTMAFLFATQTIAMSSQCFGQVVEADKDRIMVRTRNRPIPKGALSSKHCCFIGTGLSVMSLMAYTTFAPYTWIISNAIWFSYLCIYIPLKQKTPWNTFWGAIVGSLPPFIGTMAQTGGIMNLETFLLAGYIFSWQFPHFYGILYENKDDYKKADFKMLSNSDPKGQEAFNHIAACTVVNTLIPLGMLYSGMINPFFLAPFYYYQAQYIKAVKEFRENEATVNSAKKLKRTAYMPFILLLTGFMMNTAYQRHKKRQQRDEELKELAAE